MDRILSKSRRDKKYLCDIVLTAYLLFVLAQFWFFYLSYSIITPGLIYTSDPDDFYYLFDSIGNFHISILNFKSIVYSLICFFSGKHHFSYFFTSVVLYLISILLVYCIANHNRSDRYLGLLTVFIFTSMTDMILPVSVVNVHVPEMMFVLLIFYFYGKSEGFSIPIYSVLYVIVCGLALFERESITLHLSILVFVISYVLIKEKKFSLLKYNFFVVALIGIKTFLGVEIYYVSTKLEHWGGSDYNKELVGNTFSPLLQIKEFSLMLINKVSYIWFMFIIFYLLSRLVCRIKKEDNFFRSLDIYVTLTSILYIATINPLLPKASLIDDIMPLFAFFPIVAVRFIYYAKSRKMLHLVCVFFLTSSFLYWQIPEDFRNKFDIDSLKNLRQLDEVVSKNGGGFYGPIPDIAAEMEIAKRQDNYDLMMFVFGEKGVNCHDYLMTKADGVLFLDFEDPSLGIEMKGFLTFMMKMFYIEKIIVYCSNITSQRVDFLNTGELDQNYMIFFRNLKKVKYNDVLGVREKKFVLDGKKYRIYFVKARKKNTSPQNM